MLVTARQVFGEGRARRPDGAGPITRRRIPQTTDSRAREWKPETGKRRYSGSTQPSDSYEHEPDQPPAPCTGAGRPADPTRYTRNRRYHGAARFALGAATELAPALFCHVINLTSALTSSWSNQRPHHI